MYCNFITCNKLKINEENVIEDGSGIKIKFPWTENNVYDEPIKFMVFCWLRYSYLNDLKAQIIDNEIMNAEFGSSESFRSYVW